MNTQSLEKMKSYREAVEFYAKNKKSNLLHNEGNEHALIIFENLFKYSTDHIRIAAKDLANTEVVNTSDYIEPILTFLNNPDARLDILLTNFNIAVKDIEHESNFFWHIYNSQAYKENRITIKDAQGKGFRLDNKPVHFCTSDSHAYRVEDDIDMRKARCDFGDETTTKNLEETFDRAFGTVTNIINLQQVFN